MGYVGRGGFHFFFEAEEIAFHFYGKTLSFAHPKVGSPRGLTDLADLDLTLPRARVRAKRRSLRGAIVAPRDFSGCAQYLAAGKTR